MLLTQENYNDVFPVQAYEAGRLKVNNQWFSHSVSLRFGAEPQAWPVEQIHNLTLAQLEPLLTLRPELILLGSGDKLVFPAPTLLAQITAQGIGIEIMDTKAACRTYNLLLAESRRVIAALFLSSF